ncbi:hypothetical protein OHB36_23585 [Streptomyces sp. NBC_00320]|nr:hypothetical protein [Streptomyces sp. NBC_00320]
MPREHGPVPTARHAPPPFDPELGAALVATGERAKEPVTPDGLAARQERDAAARPRPTVRKLRDGGRFEVEELRAPGPRDGREVTLVSARPAGVTGPLPLLYYMHGGGMIMGNAWSVLPRLSELPFAYIDVGSAETFRDEAVACADAIWQAGGEAELHVWPGAFHGSDTLAPRASLSQEARDARTRWLRRTIGR